MQTLYHRVCHYWINGKGLLKSALTNDNMVLMHYCSRSFLSLCRCCPFCRRCFPLWRPLRWPWSSAPCGGRAGRLWVGPSSTWERWTWWVWQDTAKKKKPKIMGIPTEPRVKGGLQIINMLGASRQFSCSCHLLLKKMIKSLPNHTQMPETHTTAQEHVKTCVWEEPAEQFSSFRAYKGWMVMCCQG